MHLIFQKINNIPTALKKKLKRKRLKKYHKYERYMQNAKNVKPTLLTNSQKI
jgi:hypothetical protein